MDFDTQQLIDMTEGFLHRFMNADAQEQIFEAQKQVLEFFSVFLMEIGQKKIHSASQVTEWIAELQEHQKSYQESVSLQRKSDLVDYFHAIQQNLRFIKEKLPKDE